MVGLPNPMARRVNPPPQRDEDAEFLQALEDSKKNLQTGSTYLQY